jgi:short-subunit dehydrogenase
MKKVIIIGATSGIGEELAKQYHKKGYIVGICGRRLELLEKLQSDLQNNIYISQIDVTNHSEAVEKLANLIAHMDGVDVVIHSSAIGFLNPEYDFELDRQTIETNVLGFVNIANFVIKHFIQQKHGHFVGISSIGGIRGGNGGSYNASKAFMTNFLEGLHVRLLKEKLPIFITDICPGFVDTQLARGKLFWMSSVQKATTQIIDAIEHKKFKAYITKRWIIVNWVLQVLPKKWLL